ncbi:TBC1 domain family member 25-like [Patiria miniata]|uniref:Rab-GAP TBC domain-containing protein n=1 Tax=Patiria miniata TaxID=46514 RepID=A0A914AYL7_PATMI|nr:TBC1 domain family member 25-like [Patiria miniata]
MAGIRQKGGGNREAIRVQVMKCVGFLQPEYKTFSIDPEITTFEMLQLLLMQAFQLKSEFTISYSSRDDQAREVYLSLLSDWDLDSAILTSSDPCLRLKVDAKPFEGPGLLEDWDVISGQDVSGNSSDRMRFVPFVGAIMDSVGKTLTRVSRIFQTVEGEEETYELPRSPLDDHEFFTFLDPVGHLERPHDLRLRVYQGGIKPSLRKVVWRHLLNIYPEGLTGKERMQHIKAKSMDYQKLKNKLLSDPREDFKNIKNMVRKDVLRTDRLEDFYANSDENVEKLFNLLATYALSHPEVSYCQGMSDLASPILFVMEDEAQAYICFCQLMKRLACNFLPDGKAMSVKFLHLTELIRCVDPDFYEYLKEENADDLYFCYRWLLLELKREFAFTDALRMKEIMWSSLPPDPPSEQGVELASSSDASPSAFAAERLRFRFSRGHSVSKESISGVGKSDSPVSNRKSAEKTDIQGKVDECDESKTGDESIPDNNTSTNESKQTVQDSSISNSTHKSAKRSETPIKRSYSATVDTTCSDTNSTSNSNGSVNHRLMSANERQSPPSNLGVQPKSLSKSQSSPVLSQKGVNKGHHRKSSPKSPSKTPSSPVRNPYRGLPPPQDFGGGNPFVMFVCLAMLMDQRNGVMAHKLDYNDMAMLFDSMVRKHSLGKILSHARMLYSEYLQSEASKVDPAKISLEDSADIINMNGGPNMPANST